LRADVADRTAARPIGAGGGGASEADFDKLIELITTTVAPPGWEQAGGPGTVKGFPNGVYVDAEGVLRKTAPCADESELAALRRAVAKSLETPPDGQSASALRKVSLRRLEKQLQRRLALGEPPTEAMQALAGLERVEYVFVYPESEYPDAGDVVLAGPAADWKADADGRLVRVDNGRPVLRLDDLVVLARHFQLGQHADGQKSDDPNRRRDTVFGCSITPTEKGLAEVRQYAAETAKRPINPRQRSAWLENLRQRLGRQDIDVFGIDPRTRVAQVLVEADYRMKLVGLGLEEGAVGVPSYLNLIQAAHGKAPPLDVLRWWFTLDEQAVSTTQARDAFQFRGQIVKVQSENQFLSATGQRQLTGRPDPVNQDFAERFTEHLDALARKYPVYAELQNVCSLALACAVIHAEDLPGKAGWQPSDLVDPKRYAPPLGDAPKAVESVVAHRVVGGGHVLAAVSGGVRIDASKYAARAAIKTDGYGRLDAAHATSAPPKLSRDAWWWD
jgi:hypothetical protein